MKITESQLRNIIAKTIKESLQETPKFEKGWNDYEKRERRLANFVDDIYGDKPTPYDHFPEFANAIDAQMHNGRIAKHLVNRGKKAMEESKCLKEYEIGDEGESFFARHTHDDHKPYRNDDGELMVYKNGLWHAQRPETYYPEVNDKPEDNVFVNMYADNPIDESICEKRKWEHWPQCKNWSEYKYEDARFCFENLEKSFKELTQEWNAEGELVKEKALVKEVINCCDLLKQQVKLCYKNN